MKNNKQSWKRLLVAGAAAAVLVSAVNVMDMPTVQAKVNLQGFDFEAHRGGRDARPENTLNSFAYAMELGVQTLEMDMQLTKDGRIVISHNPVMNSNIAKGPNGKYVKDNQYDIRTMTLAQVKQFDIGTMNPAAGDYFNGHGKYQMSVPGAKMATLEEVFELVNSYGNNKITFNIETKSYPDKTLAVAANSPDPEIFVKKFYEIVTKYHMEDRVMLQSFDWRTLKEMKKLDPKITLVALTCEQPSWGPDSVCRQPGKPGASPWMAGLDIDDYNGDYVQAAKAIGADVISPYWEELTPELTIEAHQMGMKVVPWTVNTTPDMNMLIDMGADGMISDKPYLLRNVLINRGIKVPKPTVNVKSPYHTGTDLAVGAGDIKKLAKGADSAQ